MPGANGLSARQHRSGGPPVEQRHRYQSECDCKRYKAKVRSLGHGKVLFFATPHHRQISRFGASGSALDHIAEATSSSFCAWRWGMDVRSFADVGSLRGDVVRPPDRRIELRCFIPVGHAVVADAPVVGLARPFCPNPIRVTPADAGTAKALRDGLEFENVPRGRRASEDLSVPCSISLLTACRAG